MLLICIHALSLSCVNSLQKVTLKCQFNLRFAVCMVLYICVLDIRAVGFVDPIKPDKSTFNMGVGGIRGTV